MATAWPADLRVAKGQAYWRLDTKHNLSLEDIGTFLQGQRMVSDIWKRPKDRPETHLNPYEWTFKWKGMSCAVGMTDYERKHDPPGAAKAKGKKRGAAERGRSTSTAWEKSRP